MNSPERKSAALIDPSITWLMAVAVTCLLVVLGLKVFFDNLQEQLREQSANEQARLFIGEEIVRGIHGIEKDLYLMAVTSNLGSIKRVNRSIDEQMSKLHHDLKTLKEGGSVRRQVLLNIEGRDEMVREVTYRPDLSQDAYVMELIEIGPLLDQVREKTTELEQLLSRGWAYQERNDHRAFFKLHDEVDAFLKHIPPYFARLDENANRLFFDSSERLRELENQLSNKREQLKRVEMGVMALVMVLAGLVGTFFLRRINAANLRLEAALNEMRRAKEEAERASRAKSEFVSRMSHELRTPLNAIIGFAELLEAEPLPPSQKNYVSLINSSGKHLMELINAVLDHAKIEAGGMTLEQISFDFAATIEAVRSIVLERASSKGLTFIADIAADLPRHLIGDPTRLRQILINLLVNAVKFTEQGSVELRVVIDDDKLVFSIRDTGIGMDQAALGRLFQPFVQADDSITRKYGGTGLGLMISKDLVDAMGGRIEVESAVGVGTCFWIRLPLHAAPDGTIAAPGDTNAAPALTSQLADLVGGRLLLVDDNRVNQQLGAAMLERLQLEFDLADNGRHALERIAQTDYALVLMDMEMPEMDGVTATRQIRRDEAASCSSAEDAYPPHLPIIAMTANALAEDRERCMAAGMDGYIAKPISLAALQNEINRLFGARRPAGSVVAAASTATATASPDRVFDRSAVIEMLGDEDLFKELAGMFITDMPTYLTELDDALAAGDWPRLARSAHTLKGLFATFVASAAEQDGRHLEQAANNADAPLCAQLVPVVRSHTEALAGALAKWAPV
jgi:signal transduction histidine kinase/CheY-like chemotaxis protein/HPt (histidine-containing phosphotransfer) domain-containing protein